MATFGGIVFATSSQATDRRTLGDIVDELARPVNASDTTIRALARDSFQAAVRKNNRKGLWPWEIVDEDITLTVNERFSTVTGAIKKPLSMHFLNSEGGVRDQRINFQPYEEFLEKYSLDFSSEPYLYTIPNMFETGQIRWFPTPSSNDYARFSYYRVTPIPKNDTDIIEMPDYVTDAYVSLAWVEFLKRLSPGQVAFTMSDARREAKEAFRELSVHVNQTGDRRRLMEDHGFG